MPLLTPPAAAPFFLPPLVVTALAGLLSWLLLKALLPLLRRRLLDQPNARSSHRVATPRGGGVSFVVVGSLLSLALGQGMAAWIPIFCLPLAVVGMLDDRFDLPAGLRYAAQVATAALLVALAPLPLPLWLVPVALIAVTAVINFMNFMDGLDGLVALSAMVLMATAGQWPVAGALAGFLIWNWSPARVFMGDVGSTWLGAVFAGLVLQQPSPWASISLLLVAFPLLGDAFFCVLRRLRAGQPVFRAHRLHLFQRLQRAGWPHRRVAALYGGCTALLALAWLGEQPWILLLLLGGALLLGVLLDLHQALPFGAEERSG
jgi:UDP-N-acetylmuramyl pentapeptide phosphotransferase/UDP-N-acetylglucosamine-1-phosphate transferase